MKFSCPKFTLWDLEKKKHLCCGICVQLKGKCVVVTTVSEGLEFQSITAYSRIAGTGTVIELQCLQSPWNICKVMGLEMLAAVLASSQLAVYGLVILRNLNYRKKIEKVHLKYFHKFILLLIT